jgi:hypothetical protein
MGLDFVEDQLDLPASCVEQSEFEGWVGLVVDQADDQPDDVGCPSMRYSITRTTAGGALTVLVALLCLFGSIRAR